MTQPTAQERIDALCDLGDGFLNADRFSHALEKYREAAALITGPITHQPIALPVYTAIGEAYYFDGKYQQALEAFQTAAQAPGGMENPLTHLRLGQTYFELGLLDEAADELTRGYMLGGRELFDGEPEKYLAFLTTRISL
jgi:tetratricopeptide (TPR) repeat protein